MVLSTTKPRSRWHIFAFNTQIVAGGKGTSQGFLLVDCILLKQIARKWFDIVLDKRCIDLSDVCWLFYHFVWSVVIKFYILNEG